MANWLYERILETDGDRKPSFSAQATNNWFKALRCQINISYGDNHEEQIEACRKFYKDMELPRAKELPALGSVFEALFFSITSSMSLERIATDLNTIPWIRPTSVIDWYYAIYFSIHSIIPWITKETPSDHARTANVVTSSIRTYLPFPFDMLAKREDGENYEVYLNGVKAKYYDLNKGFLCMEEISQGMLAQYIKGTADWYTDRTKKRILADSKTDFLDFRSKKARTIRDKQLLSEVGFLHCAFRQRVKANYRDSLYLAYDYGEEINLESFTKNLCTSARFTSIMALAFIEKKQRAEILCPHL